MKLPSQTQILLPLLETLSENGGAARPRDVYDSLASKLDLPNSGAPPIPAAVARFCILLATDIGDTVMDYIHEYS